jgi:hypothetical protein
MAMSAINPYQPPTTDVPKGIAKSSLDITAQEVFLASA